MKLLDLFCGAGGASMGYHRAGFDVTGVDLHTMQNYPFTFIQGDALDFLAEHGHEFDVIAASPPCQAHTAMKTMNTARPHHDFIPETRRLLIASGKPYVIENVVGAPLINPLMLCGSSFGLRVRRHRLFESNVLLLGVPCQHAWQDNDKVFDIYEHGKWRSSGIVGCYGTGGWKGNAHWDTAMGIDWMTKKQIVQSIPPAYTEFIGRQIFRESIPDPSIQADGNDVDS